MPSPFRDLRHAARSLLKTPGSTFVAVATLAVALGANTALFSVVDAVLVRPLPYADPERVIQIWGAAPDRGAERTPLSFQRFTALEERTRLLGGVGAFTADSVNLTGVASPTTLRALRVSHGLLDVLGIRLLAGRGFLAEEDVKGGPRVAILTASCWRRLYGETPPVAGGSITLDGNAHAIVGVVADGLEPGGESADVLIPRVDDPSFMTAGAVDRGAGYLDVVGRLKPGVALAQAESELHAIARGDPRKEGLDADLDYVARTAGESSRAQARPTLRVLLGAVALVLLIACANVANLLLARASGRRREIAVRAVLGAGRGRLVSLLLTESLLLALVAGAAGLILARWGLDAVIRLGASRIPHADAIHLDPAVLLASIGVALLTGLAFGILPALHASTVPLNEALRETGAGSMGGRRGRITRGALVVAEVALSVVLLVGAGLLIRTFAALMSTETGFDPHRAVAATIKLPGAKYATPVLIREFHARLAAEVERLPGIVAYGASQTLPLLEPSAQTLVAADTPPVPPPGERSVITFNTVTPGWFKALGIPLKTGRLFTPADDASSPIKVVVSEAFARRFFAGAAPVGRHVMLGKGSTPYEVIGVVGDIRSEGLDAAVEPAFYLSALQRTVLSMTVVARTTGDPASLGAAIARSVVTLDPDQPVAPPRLLDEIVGSSLAGRRFVLALVAVFALVALLLAAAGIYGVTMYSVSQRTSEIGLRRALGATAGDVVGMVARGALRLALGGLVFGLAGALAATRLMSSLLHGVGFADPLTYAAIAILLGGVALLAACVPALRAARIDPMKALRYE